MSNEKVDINRIAQEVGLSKTTVSYVLSDKYRQVKIAPATARRVMKVADKLGYRSNYWAQSLVRKRSRMIGVLFPDITGSAAHQITEGIEDEVAEYDYNPLLAVSFWRPEKERREVELMLGKRVEGIIALPQAGSEETYKIAQDAGCPVVFVSDWLPGINASSVTLDPEDAIHKILGHLYQLGKTKIHLLGVDYPSRTLQERELAFKSGLKKLGLEYTPDSVSYSELAKVISIYEQVRLLVEKPDRPDALVCISDAVAMEVLSELARLNVNVPDDISVASIGNLTFTDHPFFSLTTVDEYRRELGRQAVKLLLREITSSDHTSHEHIRIKGPLITRQSTSGASRTEVY